MTTTPSHQVEQDRRPGWPEVAAAAGTYLLLLLLLPPLLLSATEDDPVARGLALAGLSGLIGFAAFFVALAVRRRGWAAFGVRRTTWRWLLIGLGWGLAAVVITRVGVVVVLLLSGDLLTDPQGSYRDAASGGAVAFALQLLLLGLLTGAGEEFAFRGVLTNALLRYGSVVAVVVSTLVFALAHGLNLALVPAITVGLLAAVMTVRSCSIWPAVVLHVVNNTVGTVVSQLLLTLV